MVAWNWNRTAASARPCLWYSESSVRSAACASSSCGCVRKESTCQQPCTVGRGGRCGGARHVTMPSIGCGLRRAYVFGRTLSRTRIGGGRKVITHNVARPREDWTVLIHDHHDAYISLEEYNRNRAIIAGNANMKGRWWRARFAAAVRFSSARCAAGAAAANSRCCTIRGAMRAISAPAMSTRRTKRGAAHSATCALMRRCRRKFCVRSRHWQSRRR